MIRVWELADGRLRYLNGHAITHWGTHPIGVTPDGRVVFGNGPEIKVWEPGSNSERTLGAPPLPDHQFWSSIAVTPDGQRAICGRSDGIVKAWQISSRRELPMSSDRHAGAVISLAVTPNGQRLISGSSDGSMKVWELPSCCALHDFPAGHEGAVMALAVTREGRHVISGSMDRTVRVWELQSRRQVNGFRHARAINAVAVMPSGQHLVTGDGNADVAVWDLSRGLSNAGSPFSYPLLDKLAGHLNWGFDWADMNGGFDMGVNAVAVTPDGRRAISGGGDGTIKVWNIAQPA